MSNDDIKGTISFKDIVQVCRFYDKTKTCKKWQVKTGRNIKCSAIMCPYFATEDSREKHML